MLLCHILDDFVLQTTCLSDLKQKSWWEEHASSDLYKNDYKMAGFLHALEWSIFINLPVMFLCSIPSILITWSVVFNLLIHWYVDNLKANERKINLITDQCIHIGQIILTYIIVVCL